MKIHQLFAVQIGNAKLTDDIQFRPAAPVIKYHQQLSNSCCFSCLTSAFHRISDNRDVTDLVNCIKQSLTLKTDKFRNGIHFSNTIITNIMYTKVKYILRYNMKV